MGLFTNGVYLPRLQAVRPTSSSAPINDVWCRRSQR